MDEPATCAVCGTAAAEPPATWSMEVTTRGPRWLCDRCTREHVRSIEARLDDAWW